MAVPRFKLVQGVSAWSSGSVVEFSSTSGSGDILGSIIGAINFSSNAGATGPQESNAWSATYPVLIGNNSYEFIWGLYVTSVADNGFTNMRVWAGPFTPIAGCTFYMGTDFASGFSAPVDTNSVKATTDYSTITDQATGYIAVELIDNVIGGLSAPIWTQVRTITAAVGGNQIGMPTIGVSLDWS